MNTEKVEIFDTTLRDGEQVPGCKLEEREKLEMALKIENLGVDIIEAGFPVSSPGDFNSVHRIASEIKDAKVCALSRAVKKDIEIAALALKPAKYPRIHTGIGTSDIHIQKKFNSNPKEVLERIKSSVTYARNFVGDVEFYAEDAGRTENAFLAKACEEAIKAGATVLNIPDTTGYCLPDKYGEKIKFLKENVKGIDKVVLSVHCHNDLGLATANSIAGITNGARQIECTVNGIGERAGNTSLEEVVMILKQHQNIGFHTNIKTPLISDISELVARKMGMAVQANKAIVGANAFAHSSGIHQDGILKCRETYEIIDPKDVGVDQSAIILTARSGRAALAYRAKLIGFNLSKLQLDRVYDYFLKVADNLKIVEERDLLGILQVNGIKQMIKNE